MAKRFTDTGKWKDEWFKKLGAQAKLLWIYLCDDCDHAGIWIEEFDVMSIRLGFKVDDQKMTELLGSKVRRVDQNHYFIPSFFKFQYGQASDEFRAKKSALESLQKYGLLDSQGTLIETPEESPDSRISIKSSIKSSIRGSAEGDLKSKALEVYAAYPRKKGKSDGIKRLVADLKSGHSIDDMFRALDAFVADHKRKQTGAEFIPYFSTWTSTWTDCLDPSYGLAEDFSGAADNQKTDDAINEIFSRKAVSQ